MKMALCTVDVQIYWSLMSCRNVCVSSSQIGLVVYVRHDYLVEIYYALYLKYVIKCFQKNFKIRFMIIYQLISMFLLSTPNRSRIWRGLLF